MPEYQVIIQPSAQKDLKSLSLEISSRIIPKISELANEPRPLGCLKLKGKSDRWRIRVGDYRVIYTINDASFHVYILKVAHRSKVYS